MPRCWAEGDGGGRERGGRAESGTDLVGIFRAKFDVGLMDIAITDTTHGYSVSQLLVLKCKLCDGVVTVVFVVLLYPLYLLVGDGGRMQRKRRVTIPY